MMKQIVVQLLEEGKTEEAVMRLEEWIILDPENWSAWMILAAIASRNSDYDLGIRAFGKLVSMRPYSSIASSGYFESLLKSGAIQEAQIEHERFRSMPDPDGDAESVILEQTKLLESSSANT